MVWRRNTEPRRILEFIYEMESVCSLINVFTSFNLSFCLRLFPEKIHISFWSEKRRKPSDQEFEETNLFSSARQVLLCRSNKAFIGRRLVL